MLTQKIKTKVKQIKVLLLDHGKGKRIYEEVLELVRTTKINEGEIYERGSAWKIVINLVSNTVASLLERIFKK